MLLAFMFMVIGNQKVTVLPFWFGLVKELQRKIIDPKRREQLRFNTKYQERNKSIEGLPILKRTTKVENHEVIFIYR